MTQSLNTTTASYRKAQEMDVEGRQTKKSEERSARTLACTARRYSFFLSSASSVSMALASRKWYRTIMSMAADPRASERL